MTLRRRAAVAVAWLLGVALAGEIALRVVGHALRRDASAPARAGADVVYCIGDSFTFGQGVPAAQAWPRVLARLLQDAMPGDAPEVRIVAVPGDSSSVAVSAVAAALAAGDARLILILSGWNANDGDFAAHAAESRKPVSWRARLRVALERSRLYRVLEQALTLRGRTQSFADVEVIPQTTEMSLYDFRFYQEIGRKNLRRIGAMCRAARVACALLTYPHQLLPPNPYSRTEYYHVVFGRTPLRDGDFLVERSGPDDIAINAVIRDVAGDEGVALIDLQPDFQDARRGGLFLEDLHHPTADGHAIMARTVFDQIRDGLRTPVRAAEKPP